MSVSATLSRDDVMALERVLAERLFEIARSMTAIGLEGEDPDDPAIAGLITDALETCDTVEEVRQFIRARRGSTAGPSPTS